jgi:DNA replication licensing factor MCM7
MGNVTIDEDDLSDDYDFMDDDEQEAERRRAERHKNKQPQLKYKNELQELANRTRDEIVIDLDDLYSV